jgi:ribosomal protein S18 acetylase RimI-like enzyme
MTIAVAPIRGEHVARVAALHCQALGGLVTALGPAAAAEFYDGYLASRSCLGFVEERADIVRGFVLGSAHPERMRHEALRANFRGIAGRALARAFRRPGLWRLLAAGTLGARARAFDRRAPELTYIAVRDDARGVGIGRVLLTAFEAGLRAQGIRRYELSVEADNRGALAFYEGHGLRPIGTYEEFGVTYRRYAQDLTSGSGSGAPEGR